MGTELLETQICQVLAASNVPVICAYLYGSRARSQACPDSDVDIAVLLPPKAEEGLLSRLSVLRGALERALGLEIDLVDMRKAPPDLVHRILRDGRLLVDYAPKERIAFEVQARNTYFDLLPYLQEYRRHRVA